MAEAEGPTQGKACRPEELREGRMEMGLILCPDGAQQLYCTTLKPIDYAEVKQYQENVA